MRKFIAFLAAMYVASQAFDSVIRWVFNMAHADAAIYLRDVDLILMAGLCLFTIVVEGKDITRVVVLCVALAGLGCASLCSGLGVAQTAFGVKLWLPFIAGVLLVEADMTAGVDLPKLWGLMWAAVCAGIFINYFVVYPWSGLLVDVGDVAISANREWTAGGVRRLSGFSRSSFDGAVIVLMLFIYLLNRWQGVLTRMGLVLVSAVAIGLTTAKGAAAALLFCALLAPLLSSVRSNASAMRVPLLGSVLAVAAAGLIIPVVSEQLPFPHMQQGSVAFWIFSSFVERAQTTWPHAFELLSNWQWLTGRGIGGIGSSQLRFEPNVYSPADSMFIYLYVTAGLLGALFYIYVAVATLRLQLGLMHHRMVYLFVGSCVVYGLTMNVIESAVFAMALGAATSFLAMQRSVLPVTDKRSSREFPAVRQPA
jgi:hypothetical protein